MSSAAAACATVVGSLAGDTPPGKTTVGGKEPPPLAGGIEEERCERFEWRGRPRTCITKGSRLESGGGTGTGRSGGKKFILDGWVARTSGSLNLCRKAALNH